MTISKSRGSTRRLGPISTGSKIVRFKIPNIDRRFTVHEDLICRTSALFKRELQKNRKPIEQAGEVEECCVCHENMDSIFKDITYCVNCGQNVHEYCIEQWKRTTNKPGTASSLPSCPMCRAAWKNEPMLKSLLLNDKLDAEAVQRYLDWLYSDTLDIPATILRKTDAFNLALLKCWSVASAMDDESFKRTVISTFFDEAIAQFWTESIQWAFVDNSANEEIKEFVLEVFTAHMEKGWFSEEGKNWPMEFVMVLADRAFAGTTKKSYERIMKEWMEKIHIEGKEVMEVEKDRALLPYRTERANKFFEERAKAAVPVKDKDKSYSAMVAMNADIPNGELFERLANLTRRIDALTRG